ncbi:MAG: hypothetical protein AAB263_10725, partial [Planctomycetota bacterium]
MLRNRPDLVGRFRRAVLRGWRYALDHREEVIALILRSYNSAGQTNTIEQLRDEAEGTATLIDRQIIPIGTINPTRLEAIADTLNSHRMAGSVRRDLVFDDLDATQTWR